MKLWSIASIVLFAAACVSEATPPPGNTGGSNDPNDPTGNGNPSCPSTVIDAPTTSACAKVTQTCLAACTDSSPETCFDDCITADPNGEACGECVEDSFLACANTAGCQAAFDAQECCTAGCADPDADACYTTTCATEVGAWETCAEEKDCSDAICFATT